VNEILAYCGSRCDLCHRYQANIMEIRNGLPSLQSFGIVAAGGIGFCQLKRWCAMAVSRRRGAATIFRHAFLERVLPTAEYASIILPASVWKKCLVVTICTLRSASRCVLRKSTRCCDKHVLIRRKISVS